MIRRNYYQQLQYSATQPTNQQPTKQKSEDKQKRMSISFKKDELWLYEKLQEYSCPGGIIKDILKEHFGGECNG